MSLATTTPAGQSIPKLAEPFESEAGDSTPRATTDADEKKKKKRSLFGFGKQKEEPAKSPSRSVPSQDTVAARRGNNASPVRTETPHFIPTSPGRGYTSTSPRLASPAGSQIFERDVQESTTLPTSPAIPSHIQTENYIPPVLDASSEAITDGHLDPDNVEIITHASHQPAAVTVTGAAPVEPSWADELAAFANERTGTDSASNYGSFDTTDVRRLSFISFADVVQAEQHTSGIAGSRDSMHLAGLTSLASLGVASNRSPSPIRSPVSSAGGPGTSPPTSKSGSIKGLEMSPTRKPLGSPAGLHPHHGLGGANSPTVSGEISIETMSQALRRTGSGDFSVVRSMPSSPI